MTAGGLAASQACGHRATGLRSFASSLLLLKRRSWSPGS